MSTPHERYLEYKAGRISLVHDLPSRINALEPFLRGEISDGWLDDATAEQVFATVYGWHMRAIQVANLPEALKIGVFAEIERRRTVLDPDLPPDVAERVAKRGSQGGMMASGQSLLRAEIEDDTVYRLWRRLRRVHSILIAERDSADEFAAFGRVRRMSDERLVDVFMWFALNAAEGDGTLAELGREPEEATQWLRERAYVARVADAVASGDIYPGEETMMGTRISRFHSGERSLLRQLREVEKGYIPPLNSEVEMYRRRKSLAFDDPFWTEERIRIALKLGL